MGWSSGIDMMAKSGDEMRFYFFFLIIIIFMQLQEQSDMECRGNWSADVLSHEVRQIDGDGLKVKPQQKIIKMKDGYVVPPKITGKVADTSQEGALFVRISFQASSTMNRLPTCWGGTRSCHWLAVHMCLHMRGRVCVVAPPVHRRTGRQHAGIRGGLAGL